MNVLVVDDDPVVLRSCQRILQSQGLSTKLCSSAREALAELESGAYDLLLVDVIMPEYDGMQLIATVRGRWPLLPILAMSGYPTPETVAGGLGRGATHFIAKPFTPEELTAAVARTRGQR